MVQQIRNLGEHGFDWLDITDPSAEELMQIAQKYELHKAQVNDCLQAGHLPKYEKMEKYSFIIFRIHTDVSVPEADIAQQLTHKIAIFHAEKFILTIHRREQAVIDLVAQQVRAKGCNDTTHLLNLLVYNCLNTYHEPLNALSKSVDHYEEVIFLKPKKVPLLKGLYYLKRKIDLIRRMLILSYEIIDVLDAGTGNAYTRETRDQYVRLQNMFDAISENIHQLLTIYFSASSQRTNDTMRILTIFSVFFMPLTFIVGIYGMNFHVMPELKWTYGYPMVWLSMGVVTLVIYLWFKRKRWL